MGLGLGCVVEHTSTVYTELTCYSPLGLIDYRLLILTTYISAVYTNSSAKAPPMANLPGWRRAWAWRRAWVGVGLGVGPALGLGLGFGVRVEGLVFAQAGSGGHASPKGRKGREVRVRLGVVRLGC